MGGRQLAITYSASAAGVLGAQKAIDQGHDRMQGGVNKTSGAFKDAFGSVIPLNAATAAAAVVGLAGATINAAAAENEAVNKSKVVFGEAAEAVLDFSDTSASAFGISKQAALQAAGGFGAMFDNAGLAADAAAEMSTTFVGLAGDLASFNDEDPSAMLERLRSGLAGEAEPLRKFGVNITAARVETEAYKSGIAAVGEELTEGQKIQARYNLILADTAKAQGDFGRTIGDSVPNQIRAARAEITDLAADLGQHLLPAALDLIETGRDIVDDIGPALELVFALAGEAAASAAEQIGSMVRPLSTLLDLLPSVNTEGEDSVSWLTKAFDVMKLGNPVTIATGDKFNEVKTVLADFNIIGNESVTTLGDLENQTQGFGAAAQELARNLESALIEALRDSTEATDDQTEASRAAADAAREQRLAILALSNEFLGIVDSGNAVAEAQRELNRLERQGKDDTKAYEEAVLAAIEAQFGFEGAIIAYGVELDKAGKNQREVEQAVRDAAREYGISKEAVGDLVGKIRDYINALDDIPDHVTTVIEEHHISTGTGGGLVAAHGFHGMVTGPTRILAGEAGPERVDITPTGELAMASARGGGGGGITWTGDVIVHGSVHDKQDLTRTIRDELVRLQRRNVTTGVK